MTRKLPARPNLDHLRTQAKRLLSDLQAGKAAAAQVFMKHLPAAKHMKPDEVRRAGMRLADAQSAVARQSGFSNWPGLTRYVQQLRELEGHWAFASLEVDGKAMTPGMIGSSRVLMDGDRFRVESPGAVYEGLFNIDVEVNPHHIDIEFVEGPEAGNWSYGIYRLTGNELTICLGLTGASRPESFATAPGSGHALERLHRESAARPDGVDGGQRAEHAPPIEAAIDASSFAQAMTPLLRQLQGEWSPVLLVSDGQSVPAAMLTSGLRTMQGNETKVVLFGQTMVHAKLRLNESTVPVEIDYLNIGRGAQVVTHGIFDWVGEEARFCMAGPGAPRPGDFSCAAGSGRILSQWKRK